MVPRNRPDLPAYPHARSLDATALRARRKTGPKGFQVAAATVAAVFLLSGASARKDPAAPPPLSLRPTIQPTSPVIPLPRPRPAIPTPEEVAAEPRGPSDCQLRLTADIAQIEPLSQVTGADGCGIDDPVKLSAVITKDKVRVAITPPATMRCTTAEAIAQWVREDVTPIAGTLGAPLGGIANYASYECRGRNRIVGAQISEHGKGNALDIRALTLANGKTYELTDVSVAKETRERLKASACARFTTVLGPASDGFHEGHIHVDLAQRRSGFRICQWAVRDISDVIPMPRERPPEAPPREP